MILNQLIKMKIPNPAHLVLIVFNQGKSMNVSPLTHSSVNNEYT